MYLVGLHIYCGMLHGPYNIKYHYIYNIVNCSSETFRCKFQSSRGGLVVVYIHSFVMWRHVTRLLAPDVLSLIFKGHDVSDILTCEYCWYSFV